jgi:histone-lysine N-methyltransferase ASH1L
VEQVQDDPAKSRTVSGETLVNLENASQSTLLKEGVAALDLPWNMSEVFTEKGRHDLLPEKNANVDETLQTRDGTEDAEDAEEERIRREKAAEKKAKRDENNKLWEKRRKSAEKQATRRSSRVPVLGKAGELMSSIANSVLGKRKDRASELQSSSRSKTTGDTESISGEPKLKKRRVSGGDAPVPEEPVQPRQSARRQEKKWLTSGLYAGQPRTFNGRLTEGKNKRKSTTAAEPFKENKVLPLPMFAAERILNHGRDFKLPFDVFSPLPAGQPKPDEWKKVNKNVFVGDAAQAWRVDKFEEYSSCLCKAETGCDHNCMNRYMYYECDDKNCDLTPEQCGNRAFEGLRQRVKKGGKYNIGVEVIKTEDRGYGVRSNRMFDPHQIIVEYTGEIITQEECEHRMRKMYKNNEV